MLNKNRQDPYARIKGKIYLPALLSSIIIIIYILLIWLFPLIPTFPFWVAFLLLWVWILVRVWRYEPVAGEKLAFIKNFQVASTLAFCMIVCFIVPTFSAIYFYSTSLLLGWIFFGLGFLAILGLVIVAWQSHMLNKAEQSSYSE